MPATVSWDDEARTVILHVVSDPLDIEEADACIYKMGEMIASVDHSVDVIVDRSRRTGIFSQAIRSLREKAESRVPVNFRFLIMVTQDRAIRLLYFSARRVLPRLMANIHFVSTLADARFKLAELRQREAQRAKISSARQ